MTKNILWLPSWYPDKISPYNGDFVQRHAKAVADFHFIQVIYIVRDEKGIITRTVETEEFISGNIREKIIYYYSPHFRFSVIDKFFSNLKYRRISKSTVSDYFKQQGKPSLVHVHVAMKAGLIARWIKRKFKTHYVISEHWTGYLPEAKDKFSNYPFYKRMLWKKVMREARGVSVVSAYLGSCLETIFGNLQYRVIPNVVDTDIFKPHIFENQGTAQFIHISGSDYQKNPEDIIKAFEIVKQQQVDFHLTMVGPYREELIQLSCKSGLEKYISFHQEMPQKDLVKLIQRSQALILYSRYETFGCVLIEANACGIPVIVSDLKVFHEFIKENVNGIFVPGENPQQLADKLLWFIQNQQQFDHHAIASQSHSAYNYKVVGEQFSKWYESVLEKS